MDQWIAETPAPPYFAVVFTSQHSGVATEEYAEMAARMIELAAQQPGFLGVESVLDETGRGITVSYWADERSIRAWHDVAEHQEAQRRGRSTWYQQFQLRVSRVERDYGSTTQAL